MTTKYHAYFDGFGKDGHAAAGLTETNFSVILSDLDVGSVIYTKNIDKPYAVGDLSRFFLAFIMLQTLGPDYQFSTEVLLDHPPQEVRAATDVNVDFSRPVTGVGNLYLRGGGDPSLTLERLSSIADELKRRGVLEVDDVIIDSVFSNREMVRSFPVDRGCLPTFVFPAATGKPAVVTGPEFPSGIEVQSMVTTGPGTVLDVTSQFKPLPPAELQKGRVGGIFAAGMVGIKSELKEVCTEISPADRKTLIQATLQQALKKDGIKFKSLIEGSTSGSAFSLFTLQSSRLSDILAKTNTVDISPEMMEIFLQQIPFAFGGQLDPQIGKNTAITNIKTEIGDRGGLNYEAIFANGSTLIYSASDYIKFLQKALGSFNFSPELRATMPRVGEGQLLLGKLLNPLYIRNIRGRDLEEKKALIKSIRAFSSFSDNSTALIGIAELPGVRKIAFAIMGDGGSNKLVRETTVFDLLKIALQLPVSIADLAPPTPKEQPKPKE